VQGSFTLGCNSNEEHSTWQWTLARFNLSLNGKLTGKTLITLKIEARTTEAETAGIAVPIGMAETAGIVAPIGMAETAEIEAPIGMAETAEIEAPIGMAETVGIVAPIGMAETAEIAVPIGMAETAGIEAVEIADAALAKAASASGLRMAILMIQDMIKTVRLSLNSPQMGLAARSTILIPAAEMACR